MGSAALDYESAAYAEPNRQLEPLDFDSSVVAEAEPFVTAELVRAIAKSAALLVALFIGATVLAPKLWLTQTLGWF